MSVIQPNDTSARHDALLYRGEREFAESVLPFIDDGLAGGEAVLVVVPPPKIELLRAGLGRHADAVEFVDMTEAGRNPARLISVWVKFIERQARGARGVRGVGEPIYADRSPAELAECQRHEVLLNLALDRVGASWVMCPYDVETLPASVIAEARRSHPFVAADGTRRPSHAYEADWAPYTVPFPEPPEPVAVVGFDVASLRDVRTVVTARAGAHGLDALQVDAIVIATSEVASNSVRHGGGGGLLRVWTEGAALVCEVRDAGHIEDPLIGRLPPEPRQSDGRGLWLVNQLCDLVEIRSSADGTAVRLRIARSSG